MFMGVFYFLMCLLSLLFVYTLFLFVFLDNDINCRSIIDCYILKKS